MDHTSPGPRAAFLVFPSSAKASGIAALLMQSCIAAFVFYSFAFAAKPPKFFMLGMTMCFFSWIGIITLRRLRAANDRIAVDDTGLWYLPKSGVVKYIQWTEITGLHEHKLMHYLSMTDRGGACKIKVEYGLENLDKLKEMIHDLTLAGQQ